MDKLLRRSHRKSKAKAEKAGKLPKAESDAEKKAEPPQTTPTKHKKDKRRSKQQENETKRPKIQHLGLISQSRPLEELPQQQRPKHEEQREPQAKPQEPLQQEYKHGLEQQQRPQVLQQDMNHSLQLTTTPDKKDSKKPESHVIADREESQPSGSVKEQPKGTAGSQPSSVVKSQPTSTAGSQPSSVVKSQPTGIGGTLTNSERGTVPDRERAAARPSSSSGTRQPSNGATTPRHLVDTQQATSEETPKPSSAEKREILAKTDLNRRHTIGSSHLAQQILESELSNDSFQEYRQRKTSMDETEVRSLPGGEFARNSPYRASLPVVRPAVNMSKAKPLGLVYLQYVNETRRAWMPNQVTGVDTVRALFVRAFPKLLSMPLIERTGKTIYIRDRITEIFYELQNLQEIRDRTVLRLVEGTPSSVTDSYSPVPSTPSRNYYSEPEFDDTARDMRQHRHVTTTINRYQQQQKQKSKQPPVPPPRADMVYTTKVVRKDRRLSDERDSRTLPSNTVKQSETSGFRAVPSSRSFTLPANVQREERVRQPSPTKHLYAVPVRHVAGSPASRPTSAPPTSIKSQTYDTPKKIEYTTAHGVKPTNPEYLLRQQRSMPQLNGSISDSEALRVQSVSGRSTPAMSDSDASFRMSVMEQQIANLAGLVRTALVKKKTDRRNSSDHSSCSSQEDLVNLTEEIMRTTKRNSFSLSESSRSLRSEVSQQTLRRDDSSTTPQACSPIQNVEIVYMAHALKKNCKQLREDLRQIRKLHLHQTQQSREMVREAFQNIQFVIQSKPSMNEHPVRAHRAKVHQEFKQYCQRNERINRDLSDLEASVEEMRDDVINRKCHVGVQDVEGLAMGLGNVSKMLAEQKVCFPILGDDMKRVMSGEMEVVVQEERFIKEEPVRLDQCLKRCKKLTGTLFTLKRLGTVQEHRSPTIPVFDDQCSPNREALLENIQSIAPNHHARIQSLEAADLSRRRKQRFMTAQELRKFEKSLLIGQRQLCPTKNIQHIEERQRQVLRSLYLQESHIRMLPTRNTKVPPPPPPRRQQPSPITPQQIIQNTSSMQKSQRSPRDAFFAAELAQQSVQSSASPSRITQSTQRTSPVTVSVTTKIVPAPSSAAPETVFIPARTTSRTVITPTSSTSRIFIPTSATRRTPTTTTSRNVLTNTGTTPRTVFGPVTTTSRTDGSPTTTISRTVLITTSTTSKMIPSPTTTTSSPSMKTALVNPSTSMPYTSVMSPMITTNATSMPQTYGYTPNTSVTHQSMNSQPIVTTVTRTTTRKSSPLNGPSKATLGICGDKPEGETSKPRPVTISEDTHNSNDLERKPSTDETKRHSLTTTSSGYIVYKTPVPPAPPKPPRLLSSEQSDKKVPPPVPERNQSISFTSSPSEFDELDRSRSTKTVVRQTVSTNSNQHTSKNMEDLDNLTAAMAELESVTQLTQAEATRLAGEIEKTKQSQSDDSNKPKTTTTNVKLIKYQV